MMRIVIEWTLDDVMKDYADYSYIEMYFLYVDVDNNDLFYEIEKNINEDLFKFLDLDVVN
jgi:hypothetical protein